MKKVILIICSCLVFSLFTIISFADVVEKDKDKYTHLVHWNVLKNLYKINEYVYDNREPLNDLVVDKNFTAIVNKTFTEGSSICVLDQDTIFRIHPAKELIGKKMSDLNTPDAIRIVNTAIENDTCARGFYKWTDKKEKYMMICPIAGTTKDGYKLYYLYMMYTSNMPGYYLKTLKKTAMD